MEKKIRVITTNQELQKNFGLPDAECRYAPPGEIPKLLGEADIFVLDDATLRLLGEIRDPSIRATFVVYCEESDAFPNSYALGLADDLLVLPARALELGRLVKMHELLAALREAEESSRGIPALVRQLQEDIMLAEKIQRRLIKDKFPPIGGLAIKSKYICGLKSGGDYFDIFEFPDGVHAGILLTDASSYSLSAAVLGALMQFSVHVGAEELENPSMIVRSLIGKIREEMKEKDKLSMFYGVLNRKTYHLKFVDFGGVFALQRSSSGLLKWGTKGDRAPFTKGQEVPEARELALEPGDRLLVTSDGWADAIGDSSTAVMESLFAQEREPQDLINELGFRLKRGLSKNIDEDDDAPMPPQDCSVLFFEVAKNVLRLAR